ncbi:MAG: hypothetical protein WBQ21_03235 [Solirubrobacteraceae bacterium]
MNDYFDQVGQELRKALRRRAHQPWYARLRPNSSRPLVVLVACFLVGGSALAATGVFQTGNPVQPGVPVAADALNGAAIPSSVHLLPLRVSDPDGGPPWGLRVLKTTRGLMCVQLGRIVDGRIGVLGKDGALGDDGRFHPLSMNFLEGGAFNCGTEDARGQAFLNEAAYGLPASGLRGYERQARLGCYQAKPSARVCPPGDLRDVFLGLLGPDAQSISYENATGETVTVPTIGSDGAYLIVLPHRVRGCLPDAIFCSRNQTGATGGPELSQEESGGVIRAVNYRRGTSCELVTGHEAEQRRSREAERAKALQTQFPAVYRRVYQDGRLRGAISQLTPAQLADFEAVLRQHPVNRPSRCPEVGYFASGSRPLTSAEVASPLSVRLRVSRYYCEDNELTVPCGVRVPAGLRRIELGHEAPQVLVEVNFVSRIAIANADSHYEINTSNPSDPANPKCPSPGGGSFGPTETDLHAGQRVRYTELLNAQCRGRSHITVGLVRVDGPAGSMPVPGLPGESGEIPVGQANITVP